MTDRITHSDAARTFDINAPELADDPWQAVSALRDECPVFHSDNVGWVVAGYPELWDAVRDYETFRSDWGPKAPSPANIPRTKEPDGESTFSYAAFPVLPIETDPPMHTKYRGILQTMFTSSAIEHGWGAEIRELAADIVAQYVRNGGGDFVEQVAYPISGLALAAVLGVAPDRRTEFQRKALQVARDIGPVLQLLQELIEVAQSGAFRKLREAAVDGRPLTDKEKLGYGIILTHAGWETTAATLSTMALRLAKDRALRDKLREHPELHEGAVEEFLRIDSSVLGLWRTVGRDTTLGGCPMERGDKALLLFGAANRDGRQFERPNEVVPERKPNHHVAFGAGVHRCLGAPLARAELRATLEALLAAPAFVVDRSKPIHRASGAVAAMHSLYLARADSASPR
ncbi:MAG: cytochrome P450 [Chloroflexota bacterium]